MNLNRLELLIGKENLEKIKNLKILIVGLGGVGGYTFETLVRSGIENITIVDFDKVDETNLNRQILTNSSNIGKYKTDVALERALLINKNIKITKLNIFLNEDNIDELDISQYDYIVDACDSLDTKELLINYSYKYKVKLISSMGTAKKMNASKLEITTLNKTSYDALAKLLRKRINKKIQNKVVVVSSTEKPKDIKALGSNSYVPAMSGILMTSYIINDALKYLNYK